VTLQQSKASVEPQQHRDASVALDGRWTALIDSEYAHRTKDATFPVATTQPMSTHQPLRHAATTQSR
jgi:anaerobic magnesium-protoporphyrin IX monomethyl ester cyclase